jgi:hypothetical protein
VALSDLAVFSEYVYSAMTEVIAQQIELFNAASDGCIVLVPSSHQGDYSDVAFFQKISGLVKRRNAYGSGAQSNKALVHLVDTMVKVAAGSAPVALDPGQFKWIQQNEQLAGAAMGQQLALDMMADMLNTALSAAAAALNAQSAVVHDGTAATATFAALNTASGKFGDRMDAIRMWAMHSKVAVDLYALAITNAQNLFTYGTINIRRDPFGRLFVISDAPALTYTSSGTKYRTLGLVQGAINVHQNDDFTDNFETTNGDENIGRTYQSEWSFNLGLKGFTWDKTNGGKSPNDAALLTATNWDKTATSIKDLAGVVLNSL